MPERTATSRRHVERQLREHDVPLEEHSAHLVRRVHQRASMLFQQIFDGLSLTPTQFAVLGTLLRERRLSQRALGRATAIDSATLSSMVRKLERDGLVRRGISSEDQRITLVELTEAGVSPRLRRPAALARGERGGAGRRSIARSARCCSRC